MTHDVVVGNVEVTQLIHHDTSMATSTSRDPDLHWSNIDDLETSQVKGTVLAPHNAPQSADFHTATICHNALSQLSHSTIPNSKCLQAELIHHVQNRQHGHIGLATTSGCTHLKSSGRDEPAIKPW